MLGDQHVHDGAAQVLNVACVVADFHAVLHGQGAGRWVAAAALDPHDAHAAGSERLHPRVVAEIRDVDAGVDGSLQHHLAGGGLDLYAIKADADFVGHIKSYLRVCRGE